jgi:hypothetical protein
MLKARTDGPALAHVALVIDDANPADIQRLQDLPRSICRKIIYDDDLLIPAASEIDLPALLDHLADGVPFVVTADDDR